jgi:hypothetical protein
MFSILLFPIGKNIVDPNIDVVQLKVSLHPFLGDY